MRSSRGGSSSRTTHSTCETWTSNLEILKNLENPAHPCTGLTRFFRISFDPESIKPDTFPGPNPRFPRRDLDLMHRIMNPGDVRQQQSAPRATLILDNHAIYRRIQVFDHGFFRRKKHIDRV